MYCLRIFIFSIYLLCFSNVFAYKYDVRSYDNHVLHILQIPASEYKIEIVKARDEVLGRETVSSIAKRENADIAINAGFFEIGGASDGSPSGTLIINGNLLSVKTVDHTCVCTDSNDINIIRSTPAIKVRINDKIFDITSVNSNCSRKRPVLYTYAWGKRTLSPYKDTTEIMFDASGKMQKWISHGNNIITPGTYVVSIPNDIYSSASKNTAHLTIKVPIMENNNSCVMGIPSILTDSVVSEGVLNRKGGFYTSPHARTAIGVDSKKNIIIVVAEHSYYQDVSTMTLDDVKSLITRNAVALTLKYKKIPTSLTVSEMKEFIRDQNTTSGTIVGLTMSELANIMLDLGCVNAINLDGGGSSTMWIRDKIVNKTIGDSDEAMGESRERPIASAIIFKTRGG